MQSAGGGVRQVSGFQSQSIGSWLAGRSAGAACLIICLATSVPANAQDLVPLGPGEASGSRSSVLPPPSGSQNPVLPPPSGYRYAPGTEGRWGDAPQRLPVPPGSRGGTLPPPATRDLQAIAHPSSGKEPVSSVHSITGIGESVGRCWLPPANLEGKGFTLRFSLRRNGTVIARPRLVAGPTGVDAPTGRRLVESGITALSKCAPLPLSPELGASIAGRPISLRFEWRS
jgi:hypothetical protein